MDSGYWVMMIVELLLIPCVMIFFGRSYMKKAPKNKNSMFAYRTDRATKNQETWEFAHKYIGKLWFYFGIVTIIVTAVVMVFVIGQSPEVISVVSGTVVMTHLIPLVVSLVLTEFALKRNFDKYGNRIS